MATLDNQPWYCNGSYLSSWLGCDSYLPTAADQVTMMQQNFGPSANPTMVANATSDFQSWLQTTGYDSTMNSLTSSSFPWQTVALVLGGVFALSLIGGGSPRRYGR